MHLQLGKLLGFWCVYYLQQWHEEAHERAVNPVLYDDHHEGGGHDRRALDQIRHGHVQDERVRAVAIQFVAQNVDDQRDVRDDAEDDQHGVLNDEQRIDLREIRLDDGIAVLVSGCVLHAGHVVYDHVQPVVGHIAHYFLGGFRHRLLGHDVAAARRRRRGGSQEVLLMYLVVALI